MATKDKDLEVKEAGKQEVAQVDGAERTRARAAFVPKVDIYEIEGDIMLAADMPGVDEKAIDITLEKGVLTIDGFVEPEESQQYNLVYAEYEVGDYHRRFTLSDEIDQDGIEATVKDGVLRLRLPKSKKAQAKKIAVKMA